MSKSKKTIVAVIAAVIGVAMVYKLAVAEDPGMGTTTGNQADETAIQSPIPGWVQKEIQFRMPVFVPQGVPVGPPDEVTLGAPLGMPFAPPVPGPDFVPPWVPEWARQGMPIPPAFPFPMAEVTPDSADAGSLQVKEHRVPDNFGGQVLMRERTWTTDGIPHRELTIVDPPSQESSLPDPSKGPATTQPMPADEPVVSPEARTEPEPVETKTDPAPAKKKGQKRTTIRQTTPSAKAADSTLDRQAQQPAQLPSTNSAGIAVTADPEQGTRIYQYRQGTSADGAPQSTGVQVYSSVQGQSGADNMVGVGVSTDSNGETRVYRYYRGNAANVPSQPSDRTKP
jgi:hypothetical protein